uniref:DUF349 domain-containing protein n=1 Tax=uncultured Thiotrichaceae bacterium TaxID=298394 RepID=A0A6S6SUC6_9GAMM|nr:MAG: Unknown protein [uncultured Thiotrichaceae bacterium]
MLGGLFKPKWQHSNARIRIQALANLGSDSAELIQLAQNDANTGVRLEAIAYLTDLPVLIQLGKRTDSIGERARVRLLGLVARDNSQDSLLVDVFGWLMTNPALVESIARDPLRSPDLRKLAIGQLDDENLLFKIASEDVSKELQYLSASRIRDQDKLKKLEKTQGRNNKKLRQLLKERMAVFQQRETRVQELESLVADLEKLGFSGSWAQEKTQHKVLSQRWGKQKKEGAIPSALAKRFNDAETVFLGRLDKYEAQQAEIEPLRNVYLHYLQDAETLKKTLNERPEELTLPAIEQQLEQWQERWVNATPLPDDQQQALNQRWMDVYIALTDKRDAISGDLGAVDSLRRACTRAESMHKGKRALQSKQLTGLQSDWVKIKRPRQMADAVRELEARFHKVMDSLNARLLREVEAGNKSLAEIEVQLDQMEADLEQEKYGEAVDLHRKISMRLKDSGNLDEKAKRSIGQRLRAAAPMIMEFKDWRSWGTDQAREHLIETAQRLENDDSMDPEQRAKEIKALRQEWRKLAQMDPGQQRKQWKNFDKKVTAAYEPSKQHFAEQAQQRNEHLKQREAICAELETMKTATDWATVDWKAQNAAINELRKHWKKCGTVGHKDWKSINQRFNDAMDGLEEHLKVERERNFKERQRLMERSVALADIEDTQEAIAEAKSLQSDWQITLSSRPREEQKLWKQFRGPIDAVFNRLKTERESQRSDTDVRIQQKDALCTKLEAVLQLDGDEFTQAAQGAREMRQEFDDLRDIPRNVFRKLEDRFSAAEQSVLTKAEQQGWAGRLAKLDALAASSEDIKSVGEGDASVQAEGESLCLQMEILLDITTPEAFRQSRMEYQIAQMGDAMCRPNESRDIREQGLEMLAGWYQLGAMPAEAKQQQQARIDVVRQAIAK